MKTKLLFFGILCFGLSFGQNQSITAVQSFINPVPVTIPVSSAPNEIFRFQPGNVTQLDLGTGFNFTNSRWFSMGKVVTGINTAYGLRFQLPNKAVTFGYQSITSSNPRVEWIGTGVDLGNLEFRVANSFSSTTSTVVATMTSFGNTVFGDLASFGVPSATSAEVGIASNNNFSLDVKGGSTAGVNVDSSTLGVKITSSDTGADIVAKVKGINIQAANGSDTFGANIETTGSSTSTGVKIFTRAGEKAFGVDATAASGSISNIAVNGTTFGTSAFEAGIYGRTPVGTNRWAGFFDGNVFTTGSYLPSDSKLKSDVRKEINATERLNMLNPVTYTYTKISEMNLPTENQHGFISQEFAIVFPELTKDITKPVFDSEGKIISDFTFKGINYNGLISVLAAGFKELNDEVVALKQELADYKANDVVRKSLSLDTTTNFGYVMEQNIPNPFSDQTTIRYQLPNVTNQASIIVLDLNGKMIKEYAINQNKGEVRITASEIGKGLFLYSLINNGKEIITKKMVIK